MKRIFTKHVFMRASVMLLTTVLFALTAQTARAAEWPAYITDVVLAGGTESEATTVKNSDTYKDYTWCAQRMNEGSGADIIYIGYKTSTSANTNGGYITDFIIIDAGSGTEGHNPPSSLTFQGHTYYLCPAAGGNYFVNSNHGNLTSQAASGWNMYLYYTKENFSDKRAVSSIDITEGKDTQSGALNCYKKDGSLKEAEISLNRGVSGTPFVYMHISTETKVNRPYPVPTSPTNLTYNGSPKKLISTSYTNNNSGTVYYRVGNSGSYTTDVSSLTATDAGQHYVWYYSGASDYGNSSLDYRHYKIVKIAKSPNNGATITCSNYLEGTTPVPSLGGTNLSTGAVTYKYCTTQNGTYTTTVPSAAGTYWVKATIASDNNCDEYTTAPVSFTITHNWKIHNSGDTEDDAYVISTTTDLKYLAVWVNLGNNFEGKFFKLGDNIAFDKSKENNFTPIGNSNYSFTGTFDGKGYTISGLNINKPNNDNVGLFSRANNATIKNLIVDNSTITGHQYVGGILGGGNSSTTVENCLVTSSVTVSGTYIVVGGIVGLCATVRGCTSAAAVSGRQNVGGIIGHGDGSTVDHCLYTGSTVTATNPDYPQKGAIIGYKGSGTLTANYYTANGLGGCNGSDANGARKAVVINSASGVTVTPSGNATAHNVSGITAYDGNNVIGYDGHFYAGATESVSLDITYAIESFSVTGYNDGNGNALTHVSGNNYTLTMTANAPTVTPAGSDLWGVALSSRDGSAEHPYLITEPAGLDLLASNVNGGNDYDGSYFVLGDNIVYTPDVLTLDLDGDGNNDSNYMPVGKNGFPFSGTFDGQGHTVSGIRISDTNGSNKAIFGRVEGTVKNLKLDNSTITGRQNIGGIVRLLLGTIENCHVGSDVILTGNSTIGGIAAENDGGTIKGCTSAATIIGTEYSGLKAKYLGGIAGFSSFLVHTPTLTDNLFTGTISGDLRKFIGAIVGENNSNAAILTNNYHTCSGMGGAGSEGSATGADVTGQATIAYEFPAANAAMGAAGSTYAEGETYEGITAYASGLYYDHKYYSPSPWDGIGTEDSPYVIYTTADLDKLASDVNGGNNYSGKYFELGNDIDYSEVPLTLDGGKSNYTAIGTYNSNSDNPFSGIFDGKGHTISGIRITKDGMGMKDSYQGVFGYIRNATVKNIKLADTSITAADDIGGIAGFNSAATIENCHVTNTVTIQSNGQGGYYYGGIAGELNDYNSVDPCVRGCTSAATVIGKSDVGGIVGCLYDGSITDCLYLGTSVSVSSRYIGAIVGHNVNNTLSNNYHTLSGVGGCDGSEVADACFAYEYPAATDIMGTAGTTYGTGDYTGITAYTEGLAYNGKYYCPLPWTGDGTAEHPFVISTTDGLNKLAIKVNAGTNYSDKYFELGNDIDYSDVPLTLDGGKSNYTPIGDDYHSFYGTFDGKGHKVSGIRISKPYGLYKSIFGIVGGTVKNLVVSDCRMEAYYWIGGIVSYLQGGTIENCHVLSDVTLTGNGYIGGIVGYAGGTVKGCTSAATIIGTKSDSNNNNAERLGGIVGYNGGSSTLTDNLFTGTISGDLDKWIGAIVGWNTGTPSNNYHTVYGLGGVGNENDATNTDQDGAFLAVSSATKPDGIGDEGTTYGTGSYTGITAYANGLYYNGRYYWHEELSSFELDNSASNSEIISDNNGNRFNVILTGRTLYKDGKWNTLCLPFDLELSGSPLAGDNVVAKVLNTSSKLDNGTLTLNFSNAPSTILAGTPFIIKWDNTGVNLTENNLVFSGVTISDANRDVAFTGGTFKGNYAPLEITNANRNSIVLLAAGNKLGYATTDRTIANGKALGAFRAYFDIPSSKPAREFVLNFGDDEETTGIISIDNGQWTIDNLAGAIYDLQGRRVENPKKGLYIVNGKKVVVKFE